jgi:hypothetical protein
VVKRDDAVVANAALGIGLPEDPGEHVVSTQAPGGAIWELRITIANGEKKPLVLEVKTAPVVEVHPAIQKPPPVLPVPSKQVAPPADVASGPSGRRVAAYAVGGVGVAGLALGGVMGGLALGKNAVVHENCGLGIDANHPNDIHACKQAGLDAAASLKTLGLVSTVGFGVGLAGVATAVVMILTEHKPAKPVTGERGPWISATVLSAGPAETMVGAHGSW